MRQRLREPAYYALVALLTAATMVPVLHLWSTDLTIPFDYAGDSLSVGTQVKNVLDHGWIDLNPQVGAPWGRHGNDFPGADNLHLMVMAVLGVFSHSYAVVMNTYFLLAFLPTAMAGAWFFRVVGVGRGLAAVLGVLFAFAPYHFYRGENHLYLAAYYPVPLAAGLIWRALTGEGLWARRALGWRGWCTKRNAATAAILALVGTASSYYSIFTLLLLSFAALLSLAEARRWRRLGGVVAAQALLAAVMVANMLPNLLYGWVHGANPTALVRAPQAAETYALKLSSLLFPWSDHRLAGLADFRHGYDSHFPIRSESPALGVVAAAGLVFLLGVVLVAAARRARAADDDYWLTQRRLGVLAVACLLLGWVGGGGTFFALFVSDSVRSWNRISIFLSVFCLAAVGLLVQRAVNRGGPRAVLLDQVTIALLVVGLFDQTPASYPHNKTALTAAWKSDQAFVDSISAVLPRHAVVFQLPYMFYPEARRVGGMTDSDQARFALHAADLRWTYGAIRGRADADWSVQVSNEPVARMAGFLAAAGVDGVEVFRAGYPNEARDLETQLHGVLAVEPLISPDGKYSFWDTRPYAQRLALVHAGSELQEVGRHVVLHPVGYPQGFPGTAPSVLFDNGWRTPQTASVTLTLSAPADHSDVRLRWPDGSLQTVSFNAGLATVVRQVLLPAGRSQLSLTTRGRDEVGLSSLIVTDPVLEAFAP